MIYQKDKVYKRNMKSYIAKRCLEDRRKLKSYNKLKQERLDGKECKR